MKFLLCICLLGKPKKTHAHQRMAFVKRKPVTIGSLRNRPVVSSAKPTTNAGGVSKSVRSRVVHMLALKPHKKLELDSKLGKGEAQIQSTTCIH